jgi:hypothetical protein
MEIKSVSDFDNQIRLAIKKARRIERRNNSE